MDPRVSGDQIKPGSRVVITDVDGLEHVVEALSGVQRGHSMLVVWVNRPVRFDRARKFDPCPWPVEAVRLVPDIEAQS